MKTIIYLVTAIMISSILISSIPFNKKNKDACISLQCTDASINASQMEVSAKIIENRLKDVGHKPSKVTIAKQGIIEICFKNEDDLIKTRHLLTLKGKFEFYETIDRNNVLKNLKENEQLFIGLNIPEESNEKQILPNSVLGYYGGGTIQESSEFIDSLNKGWGDDVKFALSKFEGKEKNLSLYLLKPVSFLDGSSISKVRGDKNRKTSEYFISMNFDEEGSKKWAEITRNNIGKEIAMVLDDQVYFAPTVMAEIKGGQSMISGIFSKKEVSELSAIIKNGELPLRFKIIKE